MALFYLVRHGEAIYDYMFENRFWGFGRDFAPLSEKGRQQAEITAKDARLKKAELIVSWEFPEIMTSRICRGFILIPKRQSGPISE